MDETIKWILGQSAIVAFLIGFIIWGVSEYRRQMKAKDELLRDIVEKVFQLFKDNADKDETLIKKLHEFEMRIDDWFRK